MLLQVADRSLHRTEGCICCCNVQIRLFTGEAVTQKFGVREQLAAVRLFAHSKIAGGQIDGDIAALTFATAFPPRRVFTEEEMMMSLGDLGSTVHVPYLLHSCASSTCLYCVEWDVKLYYTILSPVLVFELA